LKTEYKRVTGLIEEMRPRIPGGRPAGAGAGR
jgi:hypothetical protein